MRRLLTTTIAPAPTGWVRPFSPDAPWNRPVAGLALHPNAATYIDRLWTNGVTTPGRWDLSFGDMGWGDWTFAVYRAIPGSYQLYTVTVTESWSWIPNGAQIPWAVGWRGTASDDAQAIVLRPDTGEEWDLWQVRSINDAARTLTISAGMKVPGSYWTNVTAPGARGSGIACYAMLPEAEEVEAGEIRHALACTVPNTSGTEFFAPAAGIEHPDHPPGVPEGARFSLAVTDAEIESWISAQPASVSATTRATGRKIARCLRDYGFFITDTGGAVTIEFESWITGDPLWTQLGMGKNLTLFYPDMMLWNGGGANSLVQKSRIRCYVPSDQY